MAEACSDPVMAGFVAIFKNIMTIVQIVVPIILLVSGAISIGKLVISPDDDSKGLKSIVVKFLAAVIIFFLPYTINTSFIVLK